MYINKALQSLDINMASHSSHNPSDIYSNNHPYNHNTPNPPPPKCTFS